MVGRDLRTSLSPIPLPRQVHLENVTQERSQVHFECLQRWKLHYLSGQPVPGHDCETVLEPLSWSVLVYQSRHNPRNHCVILVFEAESMSLGKYR